MTNELNNKRMSDDELEGVAGGVTPPTIDPSVLSSLMHSTVSTAVAGGGAYTVDTHTPAHADTGTSTITGQTQTTVSGSTLFGGQSWAAPDSHSSSTGSVQVPSGTVTINENMLHINLPPGSTAENSPTVEVMHLDNTGGGFQTIIPSVSAMTPTESSNNGGTYGIANREGMAFNTSIGQNLT